jgi:uncharacterized membrane protein
MVARSPPAALDQATRQTRHSAVGSVSGSPQTGRRPARRHGTACCAQRHSRPLGYNQLTARAGAQVLASCGTDPLLTLGSHGAGRSAAFASDCAPHWCPPGFMNWPGYDLIWGNLVRWLGTP